MAVEEKKQSRSGSGGCQVGGESDNVTPITCRETLCWTDGHAVERSQGKGVTGMGALSEGAGKRSEKAAEDHEGGEEGQNPERSEEGRGEKGIVPVGSSVGGTESIRCPVIHASVVRYLVLRWGVRPLGQDSDRVESGAARE